MSKCSRSSESLERTQKEQGRGERGRYRGARKIKMLEKKPFMVNDSMHSRRLMMEEGDCMRLNLDTG